MDPLSSLGSALPSDLTGQLSSVVKNAAANAPATQNISPAELAKLDAPPTIRSFAPGSVNDSFENMLGGLVNEVAQKQATANGAINGLLSGQNVSLHQAMISMEEANVSFQLMVEVRNKLLDSYQELMKMQV